MGSRGIKTFDSDDALDWMHEFIEAQTLPFLKETLISVIEEEYIEEPYGSSAVAAAEIIAALLDKAHGPLPDELNEVVSRFKPKKINDSVIALARQAVNKILEHSELKKSWEVSDDYAKWQSNLQELGNKLA